MAVLAEGSGVQFLVGPGDQIFETGAASPIGVVEKVSPVDLAMSARRGETPFRVFPGRPVPGARGLTLRDVVPVRHLEYRHRVVPRGVPKILHGELYLVGLQGTRAVLQRDVEAASPTLASEQRLAAVPLTPVAPRTWEIRAADLKSVVESSEDILKHAVRDTALDFSPERGIGAEVKTPIADVRLDRRGFLVTSPNLASRAGLEVGDRILAVNAMPIEGAGDLIRMYRHLKNDPAVTRVDLTIERQNTPQTLTYRVR
ncbi:MAG: hypothetical protein ACE147_14895 [Candidatus Methylomirabilales bacterium]